MRVAIIENTAVTHHGQVGVALHEAAAVIELYKPWLDGRLPKPDSFDALISFGGEQTALSDQSHPYLPELAALLYDTAMSGKATLGICLGAQAMARGAGAQNTLGQNREFGWCQIELTDQGRADPVFSALPARFPIFEWHGDHYTLPPGAVHLATNAAAAVQAYKIGRAGYATQFHFEANRAVVADWARRFPELVEAQSPGFAKTLPATANSQGIRADLYGLTIARAWVDQIN